MTSDSETPSDQPADEQRLKDLSLRFREAWQDVRGMGGSVDLVPFLPASGDPLRARALEKLVAIDLNMRWDRGMAIGLEQYLERYPELGTVHDLPVQLIHEEFRARQQRGDRPPLSAYRSRFPSQFEQLEQKVRETAGQHESSTLSLPGQRAIPPPSLSTSHAGSGTVHTDQDVHLPISGDYMLVESIGAGNYGEVWRAKAPGGVEVAIKIIRWPMGHKMTQQELRALDLMKCMRHPFLLQIQAYWPLKEQLLIVMDLADGSLEDRFRECQQASGGGIPANELIGYFRDTAEALDYLHSAQVLHRDIKPANILLVQGRAKVGDFGLARVLEREEISITATSIGTPLYMAPEVWDGKVGPRSDQYSLAVTYVELRLGRPLFTASSMVDLMREHLEHQPDLAPLPDSEQAALHQALAKDPIDRFENCSEFVHALKEALEPARPQPSSDARQRRYRVPLVLFVFGLLLVGWFAWLWLRPELPPNCGPAEGAKIVYADGRFYYDRIRRTLLGGKPTHPVVFLLIPQNAAQRNDPDTFYIMENKVWNELFAAYTAAKKTTDVENSPNGPQLPDDAREVEVDFSRLPRMNVTVDEAYRFAKWLGGDEANLPTDQQWDKAAGMYEDVKQSSGPFQVPYAPDEIAVNRSPEQGPAEVGTSEKDISPFGCRDMAGNGLELTRTIAAGTIVRRVPLDNPTENDGIVLRGRLHISDAGPLEYNQFADAGIQPYTEASPNIGFRVVIEVR